MTSRSAAPTPATPLTCWNVRVPCSAATSSSRRAALRRLRAEGEDPGAAGRDDGARGHHRLLVRARSTSWSRRRSARWRSGFAVALAAGADPCSRSGSGGDVAPARVRASAGERALVVEDVVTTGASAREVWDLVGRIGRRAAGRRRAHRPTAADPGFPCAPWCASRPRPGYPGCPLCARRVPMASPGIAAPPLTAAPVEAGRRSPRRAVAAHRQPEVHLWRLLRRCGAPQVVPIIRRLPPDRRTEGADTCPYPPSPKSSEGGAGEGRRGSP